MITILKRRTSKDTMQQNKNTTKMRQKVKQEKLVIFKERIGKLIRGVFAYVIFIIISLLVAIPLISMVNTSLTTTNQPYLLKTTGDLIWSMVLLGTTLIASCGIYISRKLNSLKKMLVVSLGIPVIIGNIALLIVSSLVKTKKHYSVDSVKSTLMNINISYIVAGITAVTMIVLVLIVNYHSGWLKKNNWIVFVSAAPGLGLGAVLYRHWNVWNQFVTSRDFSNYKFAQMMNDFANAGIPMNFGRANQPAYVLTYFGPLLTYIILLIGGVVLVQKAEEKIRRRKGKRY